MSCFILHVASCKLRFVSCRLHAHVVCSMLSAFCCVLHAACCLLHAACCELHSKLRAASCCVAVAILSVACCLRLSIWVCVCCVLRILRGPRSVLRPATLHVACGAASCRGRRCSIPSGERCDPKVPQSTLLMPLQSPGSAPSRDLSTPRPASTLHATDTMQLATDTMRHATCNMATSATCNRRRVWGMGGRSGPRLQHATLYAARTRPSQRYARRCGCFALHPGEARWVACAVCCKLLAACRTLLRHATGNVAWVCPCATTTQRGRESSWRSTSSTCAVSPGADVAESRCRCGRVQMQMQTVGLIAL